MFAADCFSPMHLPVERLSLPIYGMIAVIFILCAVGMCLYMDQKGCLETLVMNSKIYLEGYDKNFFLEE